VSLCVEAMKKLLTTAAIAFGALSWSHSSHACSGSQPLSKLDVAFAGVIFEGSIREVNDYQFVLDVNDVIRGELAESRITVRFPFGYAYGPPKTVDDFIDKYGDYTRVALIMPEHVETFCPKGRLRSNGNPAIRFCDYYPIGLQLPKLDGIPNILKNNCGAPYLFSVESYEKSRNYENNLENFERRLADVKGREFESNPRELYESIVGDAGPLPWRHGNESENIAADLYLKNPDILNEDLSTESAKNKIQTLLGDGPKHWEKSSEEYKSRYIDRLASILQQMKVILEKDPNFADRLIEEYE